MPRRGRKPERAPFVLKRLSRKPAVQALLAWLAAHYIRLVRATTRWQVEGRSHADALWDAGQPFILAFWHGRLLLMPACWRRGVAMNMLISHHPDGELIARTIAHFGLGATRGSSKKGGSEAVRALVKAARAGECLGFTPDGPRGPRMRAASGVVDVARLSGLPIVPVTLATRRRRVLGSWDRFCVAWPFGRGVILWGAPLSVPRDADADAREAARAALEDALNRLTAQADTRCGHTPVVPDAPLAREEAAARA